MAVRSRAILHGVWWTATNGEPVLRKYKYQIHLNIQTAFESTEIRKNFESLITIISRSFYSEQFGLYHVDFKSKDKTRTPKVSAKVYANIVREHAIDWNYQPEPNVIASHQLYDESTSNSSPAMMGPVTILCSILLQYSLYLALRNWSCNISVGHTEPFRSTKKRCAHFTHLKWEFSPTSLE